MEMWSKYYICLQLLLTASYLTLPAPSIYSQEYDCGNHYQMEIWSYYFPTGNMSVSFYHHQDYV